MIVVSCSRWMDDWSFMHVDDSFSSVLMPWCVDIMAWYYMQMLWWSVTIGLRYVLFFNSGFAGRHMLCSGIDEVCWWDPQHGHVCDASFDLDSLADALISVGIVAYVAHAMYLCDAIHLGAWILVNIMLLLWMRTMLLAHIWQVLCFSMHAEVSGIVSDIVLMIGVTYHSWWC